MSTRSFNGFWIEHTSPWISGAEKVMVSFFLSVTILRLFALVRKIVMMNVKYKPIPHTAPKASIYARPAKERKTILITSSTTKMSAAGMSMQLREQHGHVSKNMSWVKTYWSSLRNLDWISTASMALSNSPPSRWPLSCNSISQLSSSLRT